MRGYGNRYNSAPVVHSEIRVIGEIIQLNLLLHSKKSQSMTRNGTIENERERRHADKSCEWMRVEIR